MSTIKFFRGPRAPVGGELEAGEPALDTSTGAVYISTDGTDVVEVGASTASGDSNVAGNLTVGGNANIAGPLLVETGDAQSVTIQYDSGNSRINFDANGTMAIDCPNGQLDILNSGAGNSVITSDSFLGGTGSFTTCTASTQLKTNVITVVSGAAVSIEDPLLVEDVNIGRGSGSVATNTQCGASALESATVSSAHNTAIGSGALTFLTSGTQNTAVGSEAGSSISTGTDNVCIGKDAGGAITNEGSNVAIGTSTLNGLGAGNENTAVGYLALRDCQGTQNTGFGSAAGRQITTGSGNICIGALSMSDTAVTGNGNIAIGTFSASQMTSGFNNTIVGYQAGDTFTTADNSTCIGYNAEPTSNSASNQITLGDSNITTLRCNQTSISSLSDARDKTNIQDVPLGLDFINQMRPVSFDWDRRDGSFEGKKDFGFIAQELDVIASDSGYEDHLRLVHKDNPDKLEADPMKTYPVLVKAVQELSAMVEQLTAKVAELESA